MILVDTNVPLRLAQVGHLHQQVALDSLQLLRLREQEHFAIAPQSLYEMYVVLTRPINANGFGNTPQKAAAEILAARGLFQILPETSRYTPSGRD